MKAGFDPLRLIVFNRSSPLVMGEMKGFFSDEGIRLEVEHPRNSAEQIRGVLAGTWDIMQTSADNIVAHSESEGADVVIFMGIDRGLKITLFARPGIECVKDLKGKALGVDVAVSGFSLVLRKMLLVGGLDLKKGDYELVAVGGSAQRYEALTSGRVAGALLTSLYDERARQEGLTALMKAGDVLNDYVASVWAGRRTWAEKHSDLLVRTLRAYVKSVDWVSDPANRKEAIALIAKDQKIGEERAARRLEEEMDPETGALPRAALNLAGLNAVITLRAELGLINHTLPQPEKYCDLRYYRQAIEQKKS